MNKGDRVRILRTGEYKGETGEITMISELTTGGRIIEVTVDYDFLYDPIVKLLVWENEIEKI